jgi:hypothetical protein
MPCGLNVCFDIQSVDDILSKDDKQEVERRSDKFEYELDNIYRVVNIDEPENITCNVRIVVSSSFVNFNFISVTTTL